MGRVDDPLAARGRADLLEEEAVARIVRGVALRGHVRDRRVGRAIADRRDRVVLTCPVTGDLLQPYGLVHGGVHCSVVETLAMAVPIEDTANDDALNLNDANQPTETDAIEDAWRDAGERTQELMGIPADTWERMGAKEQGELLREALSGT